MVDNGKSVCVKDKKDVSNCEYLFSNNHNQCAICRINYYYSSGKCLESSKYNLSLGAHSTLTKVLASILLVLF